MWTSNSIIRCEQALPGGKFIPKTSPMLASCFKVDQVFDNLRAMRDYNNGMRC